MPAYSKIGEGGQYTVYDMGNGRVFKEFHSYAHAYWAIARMHFPFIDRPIWNIPSYVANARRKAIHSFTILESTRLPAGLFANVKRQQGLDYEQDRVIPLSSVLNQSPIGNAKKRIDQFIIFNQRLLKNGIMDKYLSISTNYGLDAQGNVVLLDIGELLNDEKQIESQLATRPWIQKNTLNKITQDEVKDYFVHCMDDSFGKK